jgi:glycosyltransferase involved in cell wall biosynthesis
MIKTKASIVIPTYNRSTYLKEAIDSALSQTLPCEVIVCDHGSTDDTPEVAKSYGDKIIYLRKEKDYGVHFCWLEGVITATHEWVHLNYDDDWIAADFMEECMKYTHDDVAFVFTQANIVEAVGAIPIKIAHNYDNLITGINPCRKIERILLNGNVLSPACILLRRKDILNGLLIGEIPLSRQNYKGVGPDILVSLLTLLDYKKFAYIDQPLAFFREHPGSITIDSSRNQDKLKKIELAYLETLRYYVILRLGKNRVLKNTIFNVYDFFSKVVNKILK